MSLPTIRWEYEHVTELAIGKRLVERGYDIFHAPKAQIKFTNDGEANALLNDLQRQPHAFVVGCVMDRQIPAERAWMIPHEVSQRLGSFSIERLRDLPMKRISKLLTNPEPLHRFPETMGRLFYSAVQRISDTYEGNAARIWRGKPTSATLVYRFLEFDGVGPKIANMAAGILAREFKIRLADYFSIDVAADIHVRRVFGRLGLCAPNATVEQLVYKARSLHPEFPGVMDLPAWEIGRNWCKLRNPDCSNCYLHRICPTAKTGTLG